MKQHEVERFAREEMMREGETMDRAEIAGSFVVALVELEVGGYELRAAQPAVIYGRKKSPLPDVYTADMWGSRKLQEARRGMNHLVDKLQ